jgi:hypothetical protein
MVIKINIVLNVILLSGFLMIAGCDTTDTNENSEETIVLNLETLEAETDFGTLHAERVAQSYVSSLGESRAIGIAFLEENNMNSKDGIGVYLYDGDRLAVLTSEDKPEGETTLKGSELSDFDATVELTIKDDVVSGTASFLDEEAKSFTANPAPGDAGVYWADGTEEEPKVSAGWVVLPDSRQWGCVCHPPFTSPCCSLRF